MTELTQDQSRAKAEVEKLFGVAKAFLVNDYNARKDHLSNIAQAINPSLGGLFALAKKEAQDIIEAAVVGQLEKLKGELSVDKVFNLATAQVREHTGFDLNDPLGSIPPLQEFRKRIADVIGEGRTAYLALVSHQVERARAEAGLQADRLAELAQLATAMTDHVFRLYGEDLYQQMYWNRRLAILFLIQAERALRHVGRQIDVGRQFNARAYDRSIDLIIAAQTALSSSHLARSTLIEDLVQAIHKDELTHDNLQEALDTRWDAFSDQARDRLALVHRTETVRAEGRGDIAAPRTLRGAADAFVRVEPGDRVLLSGDQRVDDAVEVEAVSGSQLETATDLALSSLTNVPYVIVRLHGDDPSAYDELVEAQRGGALKERLAALARAGGQVATAANAINLDFLGALGSHARARSLIQAIAGGHQSVLSRAASVREMRTRLLQGRSAYLQSLQEEIAAAADDIRALHTKMEDTTPRLQIMGNTSSWVAQLGILRSEVEGLVSDGMRADLARDADDMRLTEEYARMVEDIEALDLDAQFGSFVEVSEQAVERFEQALGGTVAEPETVVIALERWRALVFRLFILYRRAHYYYSRVSSHESGPVSAVFSFLDQYSPLTDGYGHLLDNARWEVLGRPIATVASLPGLVAHEMNNALRFVSAPATHQALTNLRDWMAQRHEQAMNEATIRDEGLAANAQAVSEAEQQAKVEQALLFLDQGLASIKQVEDFTLRSVQRIAPPPSTAAGAGVADADEQAIVVGAPTGEDS